MSFAIQLLRKICCTFTAAYVRGPGFVLDADLASEIQIIRLFRYRGDGLSLTCKRHVTVFRYPRALFSVHVHQFTVQCSDTLGHCPVFRHTGALSSVQITMGHFSVFKYTRSLSSVQTTGALSSVQTTMGHSAVFRYNGALSSAHIHWGTFQCSNTTNHCPVFRHTEALSSVQIRCSTVQCSDKLEHFPVFKYTRSLSSVLTHWDTVQWSDMQKQVAPYRSSSQLHVYLAPSKPQEQQTVSHVFCHSATAKDLLRIYGSVCAGPRICLGRRSCIRNKNDTPFSLSR